MGVIQSSINQLLVQSGVIGGLSKKLYDESPSGQERALNKQEKMLRNQLTDKEGTDKILDSVRRQGYEVPEGDKAITADINNRLADIAQERYKVRPTDQNYISYLQSKSVPAIEHPRDEAMERLAQIGGDQVQQREAYQTFFDELRSSGKAPSLEERIASAAAQPHAQTNIKGRKKR